MRFLKTNEGLTRVEVGEEELHLISDEQQVEEQEGRFGGCCCS